MLVPLPGDTHSNIPSAPAPLSFSPSFSALIGEGAAYQAFKFNPNLSSLHQTSTKPVRLPVNPANKTPARMRLLDAML